MDYSPKLEKITFSKPKDDHKQTNHEDQRDVIKKMSIDESLEELWMSHSDEAEGFDYRGGGGPYANLKYGNSKLWKRHNRITSTICRNLVYYKNFLDGSDEHFKQLLIKLYEDDNCKRAIKRLKKQKAINNKLDKIHNMIIVKHLNID